MSHPFPDPEAGRAGPASLRRAGRILVGTLVALVLFFALGEILARSLNLVDRLNGFPRQLYQATDDEDLPYLLRRSVDTTARGERVVIDENGMRVGPGSREPDENARRILLLGDSVVFGYRLDFDETLGVRLEEELEARTGRPHRVLNGGVEGYNTANELAWFRRYGLALDPDVVVVVFNLNDYDYGPVMGPNGILTTDRSERVSTWSAANLSDFYVLLRWLYKRATRATPTPPAQPEASPEPVAPARPTPHFDNFDRFVSNLRKEFYRAPTDERWPQLIAALRGLRDETESRGIPLMIAILPDGDQIGVAKPDLTPQRRLARICRRERLTCFDFTTVFAAHEGDGPLFMDIMHPNAKGHDIIGRTLAGWIDEAPQ